MHSLATCRHFSSMDIAVKSHPHLKEAYSLLMVAVSRAGHLSFVSSESCSPVYQWFCHEWMTLTDVYKASRTISMFNKTEENISFLSEMGDCRINWSTFRLEVKTTEWCFITVDGSSLLGMGTKNSFKVLHEIQLVNRRYHFWGYLLKTLGFFTFLFLNTWCIFQWFLRSSRIFCHN